MNISENSLIYRFQADALVSEGRRYIPTNLCPYMRRFIRLFVASCAVLTAISLVALVTLIFPIILFMALPFEDFAHIYAFGAIIWTGGLVYGGYKLFKLAAKRSTVMQETGDTTKKAIHKAWVPVQRGWNNNVWVKWYKAHHDQICPPLNFYDD